MLTHDGITLCKAAWAEKLGISPTTLGFRLKSMESEDRVFHIGPHKPGPHKGISLS
jgi:hypothetical protein